MTDLRKAAEMALELLENHVEDARCEVSICKTVAALRQALSNQFNPDWNQIEALQESLLEHMAEIQKLRQALAQPEQEPVAWYYKDQHQVWQISFVEPIGFENKPLYAAPPKREWVGLTHEERFLNDCRSPEEIQYAIAIEAKLKEKNNV